MTADASRRLLMAGLPETGKTSFLALFYTALVDGRTEDLSLAGYQDEREYLNEINGRLLRCEPAIHTEFDERRDLSLSLTITTTDDSAELRIPDLSGETWEDAVLERTWTSEIEEQVRGSEAMLIFLHPRKLDPGPTIADVAAATRALESEEDAIGAGAIAPDSQQEPSQGPAEEQAVSTIDAPPPTQVLITDLLQLTLEQRGPRPARACLIISAWDRVSGSLTPDEFVAKNLPLLDQYIQTNVDWLQARTFGVSAQGGDFETDTSRQDLVERDAVARAVILGGDGGALSVESPITWALRLHAG